MRDEFGRYAKGHRLGFEKGYTPWNKGKDEWGIRTECYQCGEQFRTKSYRAVRSKRLHCSKECYTKTQDTGAATYWQKAKRSPEYKEWRKKVFERDDYTCLECGVRNVPIQAHHVKPKALYKDLMFDVENGETLCVPCHRKTDTYGKRPKDADFKEEGK